MKQYSTFIFESFDFVEEETTIRLNYSLDDEIHFTETIRLPIGMDHQRVSVELVERAIFALHLIGGISYYKTCCPKNIVIKSGHLTEAQADFWNTVYTEGLGEFCFKNKIDPNGLVNFPADRVDPLVGQPRPKVPGSVIVPVGGGKDSILSVELLKEAGFDVTLMRLGSHPVIDTIVEEMDLPMMTVERTLDSKLFELNEQGALNGHVPITAYISFLNVVLSVIYGYEGIIMSNERSASEGNTMFEGHEVNHQWSKGLECEKLLQQYISTYITPDIDYFSLLRTLSELAIVKHFTEHPQYLKIATSCNKNWKIAALHPEELSGLWCNTCPKCAFVFALYAACLPRDTVEEIFGHNMYNDGDLLSLFRQLLGTEGIKPFECVGTPDEMKAAMIMAHERGDFDDTVAMQMFMNDVLPSIENTEALVAAAFEASADHAIPQKYL